MRCPGQDPRYWTEDVVSDVPCPECGRAVEFFKDETSARCPGCGHKFRNPNLDLACAQWCAFAEECLGYAPDREAPPTSGPGALASRLIQAVKEVFEENPQRLAHALLVFQHAKELLSKEGGDPRVVLAAALLLDVDAADPPPAAEAPTSGTKPSTAAKILRGMKLDDETIDQACSLLAACRSGEQLDTTEFALVRDADLLARLTERRGLFDQLPSAIQRDLRTQTARKRARGLFGTTPDNPDD